MTWLFHTATLLILAFTLFTLATHGRQLMSTQETIDALVTQLTKVKDEILGKIADLNVQIEDANVADVVDTSELTAVVEALDAIVPDATNDPPF